MDIRVEVFTKVYNGHINYFLNISSPYSYLGEAFWEWMNKEKDIIELIDGVEKTMQGEWVEPLPLDFGSETVSVSVYPETCHVIAHFVNHQSEEEKWVPTEKVLHLLNLWLHF